MRAEGLGWDALVRRAGVEHRTNVLEQAAIVARLPGFVRVRTAPTLLDGSMGYLSVDPIAGGTGYQVWCRATLGNLGSVIIARCYVRSTGRPLSDLTHPAASWE